MTHRARADINERAHNIARTAWRASKPGKESVDSYFNALAKLTALFCEFSHEPDANLRRELAEYDAMEYIALVSAP